MGPMKMKTKEQQIIDREEYLLRHEATLRRSRIGAIGLIIMLLLTSSLALQSFASRSVEDPATQALAGCVILCVLLAYHYNIQIWHIDSIKLYRQKLKDKERSESSNTPTEATTK